MKTRRTLPFLRPLLLLAFGLLAQPSLAGVIKIGVFSPTGFEAGIHRWQPTADYLASRVPGHIFQILPYRQLPELEQDARRGKFDFVLTQPASFVQLEQQAGLIRLLTRQQQDGAIRHAHTATVIFTRADTTGLKNIQDFKQIKFITTSEQDFSGWQAARLELVSHHKLPASAFSRLEFAGDAEGVLRGVMEARFEVGAMSARDFDHFLRQGIISDEAISILHRQEQPDYPFAYSGRLYPHWPLGAVPATPVALQQAVVEALLALPIDHPALQAGQYAGWTTPRDYRAVRPLLDKSLAEQVVGGQLVVASLWLEQYRTWLLLGLILSLSLWLLVRLFGRPRLHQA